MKIKFTLCLILILLNIEVYGQVKHQDLSIISSHNAIDLGSTKSGESLSEVLNLFPLNHRSIRASHSDIDLSVHQEIAQKTIPILYFRSRMNCGATDLPGSPNCNGVCEIGDSPAGPDCDGFCGTGDSAGGPDCDGFCGTNDSGAGPDCDGNCVAGDSSAGPDCDGICSAGESASSPDCDGTCGLGDSSAGPDCDGTCSNSDSAGSPDCDGNCGASDSSSGPDCNGFCGTGDSAGGSDCNGLCNTGDSAGSPDCNGACGTNDSAGSPDCNGLCNNGDSSFGPDCNGQCDLGENSTGGDCDGFCDFSDHPNSVDCNPVPVELTVFSAESKDCHHHLFWQTAADHNFANFEVQQKLAKGTFKTITNIDLIEGATPLKDYRYSVEQAYYNALYRLKMIDWDGSFEYSPIISASAQCTEAFKLYPNPTTDRVTLFLDAPKSKTVNLKITNLLGQTILAVDLSGRIRSNSIDLDISQHPPGTYFFALEVDGVHHNRNVIKQ